MITSEIENITTEEDYIVVQDLKTQFFTSKGIVKALDGVSLSIRKGEIFGLVGESGCGKSVTATSVMDLIPDPPGRIISGHIYIDGFDIIGDIASLAKINIKSETDVRIKRYKRLIKRHNYVLSKIRGQKIAMIFQEPFLALNPVFTIGEQIMESILLHSRIDIANAIIRRETITPDSLKPIAQKLAGISDAYDKRKEINSWARDYGVPEIENDLVELFDSTNDPDFLARELFKLMEENKKGINLSDIEKARQYYQFHEYIFNATLQLLSAERESNQRKIEETNAQLKSLQSQFRSQFLAYSFLKRVLSRKYEAPFKHEARRRTLELLRLVNLPDAERVIDSYPHELSGGMQQRAMIAMALASNPSALIADEPTTALDVTTQAQILELMRDLNKVTGSSILFITHDLAVIAEMCDRLGVMYAGNLVEESSVSSIFNEPKHPYTVGLMRALPRADKSRVEGFRLESIPGSVPNLITPPTGCRFHPRCKFKMDVCAEKKPKLVEVEKDHKVACFLYSKEFVEVENNGKQ